MERLTTSKREDVADLENDELPGLRPETEGLALEEEVRVLLLEGLVAGGTKTSGAREERSEGSCTPEKGGFCLG